MSFNLYASWCAIFDLEGQPLLEVARDREAVASQSPGLLQPWGTDRSVTNPERVATKDATALWLDGLSLEPRVETTLGSETQPLRGRS